ncbi:brap-2 [Symbiodinium sp. KB8]|nr:brap-2 [Symbiodinium sp. KB8]
MSTFSIRIASATAAPPELAPTTPSSPSVPVAHQTGGDSAEQAGDSSAATDGRSAVVESSFSVGVPANSATMGRVRVFRQSTALKELRAVKDGAAAGPSPMLCAIAVPGRLLVTEFCSFISPFHSLLAHMRVVRDSKPGRYMVLMLFRRQEDADACFREHDGRAFNAFETQRCALVYVKSVHIEPPAASGSGGGAAGEGAPEDATAGAAADSVASEGPSVWVAGADGTGGAAEGSSRDEAGDDGRLPTSSPTWQPAEEEGLAQAGGGLDLAFGASELGFASACMTITPIPSCPVCLDRLDSSASGLLTTLCNHSFHADCLRSWAGMSCPVCRHFLGEDGQEATRCERCDCATGLWMCLVCGHVGCGRYESLHGLEHFEETGHTYAVELATQRVWDYAGDGYVHRLLENTTDGKLVESSGAADEAGAGESAALGASAAGARQPGMSRPHRAPDTDSTVRGALEEKREALAVEYGILLTSQLEAQRQWFEGRRREAEEAAAEREAQLLAELEAERAARQEAEARASADQLRTRLTTATSARLEEVEKESVYLRELCAQLTADQHKWKAQVERQREASREAVARAEARAAEMEAQARDMMFYLDAQSKVQRSADADELRGAAVLVTSGVAGAEPDRSRASKRKAAKRVAAAPRARQKAKVVMERARKARMEAAPAASGAPPPGDEPPAAPAAAAPAAQPAAAAPPPAPACD